MSKCEVCRFEDGCPPECTRERDRTTLNATGAYLSEAVGFHALALARYRGLFDLNDVTAHMSYVQRVIGDCHGILRMGLLTLDEANSAVRFKLCECFVIEDDTMRDDVIEFRDNGRVLAKIVNLNAKMPRFSQ
jgi:hypothetical protein